MDSGHFREVGLNLASLKQFCGRSSGTCTRSEAVVPEKFVKLFLPIFMNGFPKRTHKALNFSIGLRLRWSNFWVSKTKFFGKDF